MKVHEYVSEFGHYIEQYLDEHPEVRQDQRRGWNIWWDHRVDLEAERLARTDTVPTPAYYYH